jgi:cob(I)alamin adenosyltransferase
MTDKNRSVDWHTGRVQVYTGDGKGKTTAALGLALRAAGAGLNVYIAQFAKGIHYSELDALQRLNDRIQVEQFGRDCFIREATEDDREAAQKGLDAVRRILAAGRHRVVILDEANIATHFGLISVDDLLDVIDSKPPDVELVVTGRRAHPLVLARADLITEMRELKHYYTAGVGARRGIEN